jgi:hypothetical protein
MTSSKQKQIIKESPLQLEIKDLLLNLLKDGLHIVDYDDNPKKEDYLLVVCYKHSYLFIKKNFTVLDVIKELAETSHAKGFEHGIRYLHDKVTHTVNEVDNWKQDKYLKIGDRFEKEDSEI